MIIQIDSGKRDFLTPAVNIFVEFRLPEGVEFKLVPGNIPHTTYALQLWRNGELVVVEDGQTKKGEWVFQFWPSSGKWTLVGSHGKADSLHAIANITAGLVREFLKQISHPK